MDRAQTGAAPINKAHVWPIHAHAQHKAGDSLGRIWFRASRERIRCPPLDRNYITSYLQKTYIYIYIFFLYLTYSRWTSSLPSCLWSQRIFPSLPGSRLTIFYCDASSALVQLVNQWLNFTYSRSHAFRYERKNTNPTFIRIELKTSALAGVQVTY